MLYVKWPTALRVMTNSHLCDVQSPSLRWVKAIRKMTKGFIDDGEKNEEEKKNNEENDCDEKEVSIYGRGI